MLKFTTITLLFCSLAILSSFYGERSGEKAVPIETAYKTRHVIILVIDGPRWTETFGDPDLRYIPKMGRELTKEGVLYTNFYNNGPTYTSSGHTAITTGFYQSISNAGKELPKRPSIFQYYLKQSNADKSEAWLVSSKGKLEILANTYDKDWWNTFMPMTYCGPNGGSSGYEEDAKTVVQYKRVINAHTPNLMLINLLEADVNGHGNNWSGYLQSIKNCDQYVSDLWQMIQSDPEMKDRTTLFVTNDHGRHPDGHKDGFVSHGDNCEGCRHISLLALGPDFKKGQVISTPAELIDISKTVGKLLGFDIPTSKGCVLQDLFL